jgi:hypothetical protein
LPESFLKESYIGSIRASPDFPLEKKESKKSGDNRYSPGYSVIGVKV